MKFFSYCFYSTPLHIASKKNNVEIVQLLLSHPEINVNVKSIFNIFLVNTISFQFVLCFDDVFMKFLSYNSSLHYEF